ncbi:MAG TPA: thioredoxin domain-containing protein [Actinomycetota bacterium]
MAERTPNRLAGETSPYLLQHANNPVDWFPWGTEALSRAAEQDKPIFLSIGYAACHWCHVMERESFENDATADLMNERFVSIKVDREERPDLDGIYMDAVQAMTGQGGWPMSAFLTPDGRPFYAGTYYPPEPRHGMPSFRQVLTGIAEAWDDRRDEIIAQAGSITDTIGQVGRLQASEDPLAPAIADEALASLRPGFDGRWGGFGGAPKFPQPMTLEFLLRQAVRDVPDAEAMATITLDRMAEGGIFDHVGGGFARYSTDGAWHVPHFEKMLYDNAQLVQLYTRAWLLTGHDRYRDVVRDTVTYLLREMQQPEGGFSSSQDADSEGVEGKFFTWSWDELMTLVDEPTAECLGAMPEGNWAGEGGVRTNVLWRPVEVGAIAKEHGIDPDELAAKVVDARPLLFEARHARVHPGVDDKVLTAWNALAIRALAEAGRAFAEPGWIAAALRCADFLFSELRRGDGRLLRSWRGGVAGGPGFADDHALLGLACLTLHETTFDPGWLRRARALADDLVRLFHDRERGGFFQTGSDTDALIVRPKELYDNAVPSGNSAGAELLLRLWYLTGDPSDERVGSSALRLVREVMGKAPTGFGHALCALDLYLGPTHEVAIVGGAGDARTEALASRLWSGGYLPNAVMAVSEPGQDEGEDAVALLRDRVAIEGVPTAYVCERFVCNLPVTTPEDLAAQLWGPAHQEQAGSMPT